MILEQLEILNQVTEENKDVLVQLFKEHKYSLKCLTVECFMNYDCLSDSIFMARQVLTSLEKVKERLDVKYAIIVDASTDASFNAIVKLHDEDAVFKNELLN